MTNLSQLDAERIINTLFNGVPVPDNIMDYSSQIDNSLMNKIKEQLDKVKRGISVARFVKGDYGSGKSHFLNVVREISLRENFVVSYFDLRAREGFDMIERVLSKIIKNLSVYDKRKGSTDETVMDFILREWATKVERIEDELLKMELDATNRDFLNIITIYGKIMKGIVPRNSEGFDLIEIINRWFQAESLSANERNKINVKNSITVRNARDILTSLAIFFRGIGYSGWLILIDEQEIIPTLMSTRKRDLSNENLRVIIDTQSNNKYLYYLFATTPEFFTDPDKGVNAYPPLRQRVSRDALEIKPITEQEMIEAGQKIKEIFCIAYPDFNSGNIIPKDINACAEYIERNFSSTSAKARIFIVSYISLLEKLREGITSDLKDEFADITGLVWENVEAEERSAYDALS